MLSKKLREAATAEFAAKNPDVVKAANAKGIDWQAILAKFGFAPIVLAILKAILGL